MKIAIVVLSVALVISLAWGGLNWTNLNTTKRELVEVQGELNLTEAVLNTTQADLEVTQEDLRVTRELLESARNSTLYTNPSYIEMCNFLQQDETSDREYIEEEYTCHHFSRDVNNNAESQGIRCGYVLVNFVGDTGHAIVAFETVDMGIVFIEPQGDQLVELAVGEHWNDLIVGYYIQGNPVVESYDIAW